MRSESVASIEVEALVDVLFYFFKVHFGKIIEGVADGDSGIHES